MQNRIEPDIFQLSQRQNICMCDLNSAAITPASAYERVKGFLKKVIDLFRKATFKKEHVRIKMYIPNLITKQPRHG